MKRKIILPTFLLTGALAAGALGFTRVSAQETDYPPIIDKLVERFGLNPDEVQDVFDEVRAEHHTQMLANFEERLNQAVTDGKITEEQKLAILDKNEEMKAKMDEWKSLTPEERHTKMQAYHEELKTWAEENGINFPFFGIGHGRGFKMGYHMGMMD